MWLRPLTRVLLLTVALTALLAWPAHAWAGVPGLKALGLAALITLVAAALGRLLVMALARMDPTPEAGARASQAGVAARLLTTLALTFPVVVLRPVPVVPFVVCLGLHYLAQLVLEVFVTLVESGQNHAPAGSAKAGTGDRPAVEDAPPSDEDASGAATQ